MFYLECFMAQSDNPFRVSACIALRLAAQVTHRNNALMLVFSASPWSIKNNVTICLLDGSNDDVLGIY